MFLKNRAIQVKVVKTPAMDIPDETIDLITKSPMFSVKPQEVSEIARDFVTHIAIVAVSAYSAKRLIDLTTAIIAIAAGAKVEIK